MSNGIMGGMVTRRPRYPIHLLKANSYPLVQRFPSNELNALSNVRQPGLSEIRIQRRFDHHDFGLVSSSSSGRRTCRLHEEIDDPHPGETCRARLVFTWWLKRISITFYSVRYVANQTIRACPGRSRCHRRGIIQNAAADTRRTGRRFTLFFHSTHPCRISGTGP